MAGGIGGEHGGWRGINRPRIIAEHTRVMRYAVPNNDDKDPNEGDIHDEIKRSKQTE